MKLANCLGFRQIPWRGVTVTVCRNSGPSYTENIMKHWNPVERQLRSWTPRGPSPKLKAHLFAPKAQPSASAAVAGDGSKDRSGNGATWHWLSPAMAVFFLGVFLYGNEAGLLHQFHSSPAPSLTTTAAAAVLTQPE